MSELCEIAPEEVAAILRSAAAGKVPVLLADARWSWDEVYAGNVEFIIDGWRVTFFNDCGELDYTDSVTAPDGRYADFDDFCNAMGDIGCPLNLLSGEEYAALERIVETAAASSPAPEQQGSGIDGVQRTEGEQRG